MKKLSFIALIAIVCVALASCGGRSDSSESSQGNVISVDKLLADAGNLVGDTVTVEGVCSHLCKHGGRKAFLLGSADSVMIRCEAFPLMGETFPKSVIRHPLAVRGVVCEERIDEEAVKKMEAQYAESLKAQAEAEAEANGEENEASHENGCSTERAAKGQRDISTFEGRMADYRAKIAARQASEGKAYLSFYYLNAISYEVLPD